MNVLIEARGIEKEYRLPAQSLKVLKGIDLTVGEGETIAVVGPSGAGKSTLMHVLGGLDRPTAGRVLFRGEDLYALSPQRRTEIRALQIGFVFQSYHLLPELDVLENVQLPAMARRGFLRRSAETRERAMGLLRAVGLEARCTHTPRELSGGEQQRAAIARALMNDPQVLLADEPTGNLDTRTGQQVLDCLFELTAQRGHTLMLVTHNEAVAGVCRRTVALRDGNVESDSRH